MAGGRAPGRRPHRRDQSRGEDLAAVRKLPLILVQRCPDDCALMQEEIFGPILPVVAYDKFDEAMAYVNARPRPLALYLFDDDPLRIDRVLQETISGGVSINDTLLHVVQEDLPFGGSARPAWGITTARRFPDVLQAQAGVPPEPAVRRLADPAAVRRGGGMAAQADAALTWPAVVNS
ncbi:Coniferyl aldehyde dehydrogenase [Chromobacterium violaceum]|uniref:Coniferyl aldehyde dehydrogenase n=1 Tax=Chromobacterium violaceum TaxID=536 RepID=A0A3S5DLK6_CHRVL|nr:Coniferyl aldehyde dehydrogenase [Chromobacterium violaceum]